MPPLGRAPTNKLHAQYKVPSLSPFHAKRKQPDDDYGSKSNGYATEKYRRVVEKDTNVTSETSDDDDECVPLNSAQLQRHTAPRMREQQDAAKQIDSGKAMRARMERMEMEINAAEAREARANPKAAKASSANYYICVFRNPQTRAPKFKTWDFDGYIKLSPGGSCRLYELESKRFVCERNLMGRSAFEDGYEFSIGTKDVMIERCTTGDELFGSKNAAITSAPARSSPLAQAAGKAFRPPSTVPHKSTTVSSASIPSETPRSISSTSFYSSASTPVARSIGLTNPTLLARQREKPRSLFNPDAETVELIAMSRPNAAHQQQHNTQGLPIVDVHINPHITKSLRPHQIEGIRFLYDSIVETRELPDYTTSGAILADEMGLGKTLQTIALIDMLLHQHHYYSGPGCHFIERALIVCPASLIQNWKNEFAKWFGQKIRVKCVDSNTEIRSIIHGRFDVLITNYEKILKHVKDIAGAQPPFGLLVCDEAHRIKSQQTKTAQAFEGLPIDRRVLLTGTPIQNNLSEFFCMIDFIAPGLLTDYATFKKIFETKIIRGRKPDCLESHRLEAEKASLALRKITAPLMLRREASLLSEHLPPKHEQVVLCSPSPLQVGLYEALAGEGIIREVLSLGAMKNGLPLDRVLVLRKLCNTPDLLIKDVQSKGSAGQQTRKMLGKAADMLPTSVAYDHKLSGKLTVLFKMLRRIQVRTNDKVVIISNFTATLDVVQEMCKKAKYPLTRLDGGTKGSDRMGIVNHFNRTSNEQCFLMLLSSKAGGVGLNLIGANRLVLLDNDWNPATDAQAMGRIHRDGQRKPCFIYRLLLAGTMDEKIFQRQISKTGLSSTLMDHKTGASGRMEVDFSQQELADIFAFHPDTACLTHDLLQCFCRGYGGKAMIKQEKIVGGSDEDDLDMLPSQASSYSGFTKASLVASQVSEQKKEENRMKLAALLKWKHHDFSRPGNSELTEDDILNEIVTSTQTARGDASAHGDDGQHFTMRNQKTGTILFVFAKMSTKAEPVIELEDSEEERMEEDGDDVESDILGD